MTSLLCGPVCLAFLLAQEKISIYITVKYSSFFHFGQPAYDLRILDKGHNSVYIPEKAIPTPWKVVGNSRREWVFKAKVLEAKYEAKLEFLRGRRGAKQNPSVGEVWTYFSGTAH